MSNHTPGPWTVNGTLIVKDCYSEVIADTDVSLNFAPKRYVTHEVRRANAQLLARAPAMHDALEVLTRTPAIRKFLKEHDPQALQQALDALGEQS
jgi:hypothetical protein